MHFVPTLFAWSWPAFAAVVAALVVLNLAFWIYVWTIYYPVVYRLIDQAPLLVPEPSTPVAGGENCEFRTADGLTLRGSYIRHTAADRRGVILFGHELNGDRGNAIPYVAPLVEAGYDVLTFDFRNHGASDAPADTVLRPWVNAHDVADVRAAFAYLKGRPDADPRGFGVLGISRGGGAALCAAADEPAVRCIFTDGAYPARATHWIYLQRYLHIYIPPNWMWLADRIPRWFFEWFFLSPARRSWGRKNNYPFVNVETTAARVTQPVLMVHGGRDTMIPVEAVQVLEQSLGGPSELWVVAEARHNGAVFAEPETYRRRVLEFFNTHLAGERPNANGDDSSAAA
jgi:pimeloyl-ACP methyl ester carboxylesterase